MTADRPPGGDRPDDVSADAPGRVNLIGEHTDYHDGWVLPTVIPQRTHVHLRRRADRLCRAWSAAFGQGWEQYDLGGETPGRGWLDYVQGVTSVLSRHGVSPPGLDIRIESAIPPGAGLASSAALQVGLLRGLRTLLNLDLDDLTLARIARAAETDFVGAPVGIMDQMAASLGRDGEALLIDCRSLGVERLALPASIEIALIDSGVKHAHAGGGYAARRGESLEAAALLGVERLRDVDATMLPRVAALPPILARRARHVVTENERVLAAAAALKAGDTRRLGALMAASHASMRDDYETSIPEIDVLVDIGRQHPDILGARLTGGGFGGAVVLIAKAGRGRAAADEACDRYRRLTGRDGLVLIPPRHGPVT